MYMESCSITRAQKNFYDVLIYIFAPFIRGRFLFNTYFCRGKNVGEKNSIAWKFNDRNSTARILMTRENADENIIAEEEGRLKIGKFSFRAFFIAGTLIVSCKHS